MDFQPFLEGPQREPYVDLPSTLDLDSPYAISSLFWTEEMWKIFADSTNTYALRQGAIEPDVTGNGTRLHSDFNQRRWFATNLSEIKVFIGIVIYMGLHPEGDRSTYWNCDQFQGPKHTPALCITRERFGPLQRFIHLSPSSIENRLPTGAELQQITTSDRKQANQR